MNNFKRIISCFLAIALCIVILPKEKVNALTQQEMEDVYRVDMYNEQYKLFLDVIMTSDYFVYHNATEEQSLVYHIATWNNIDEMKSVVASLLETSENEILEKNRAEVYCNLLSSFLGAYKESIGNSSMPIEKVSTIEKAINEVSCFYLKSQNINVSIKTNAGDIDYSQILKQVLDRCGDDLSESEQVALINQYKLFVESATWLEDVKSISKIVSSTTKILDIAQKSLSMFAELETYKATNDHILVLLQDLADNTDDLNLSIACYEMKKSLEQTYEENLVSGVERIVREELFNYALDGVKEKVFESFGLAGVMAKIGVSCGIAVSNAWFNTDDQIALMKSIWCINTVTEVLVEVLQEKMEEYNRYTTDTSYKASKASLIIFYIRVLQTLREKGEECYYNLQIKARSSVAVRNLAAIDIFDFTGIKSGDEQVEAWYYEVCNLLDITRSVLFEDIDPSCYLPAGDIIEIPVFDRLATDFSAAISDGIYTLKNYKSGKMLNVYAGKNADGTNITTWEFDGTTDQRFYIKHISNGQYVLYAVSSVTSGGEYTRCLDIYTGDTSKTPSRGDNVDIWTRSDSLNKSQLFYIVKADTGGYILESCASPSMVVGAEEAYANGGNVSVQLYSGSGEQRWEICDITGSETLGLTYHNDYINTGSYAEDLIGVAQTQLGYKELSARTGEPVYNGGETWYTKYGDRFNNSAGAWCAFFVMWCAEQAGVPRRVIPQSQPYGNCGTLANWFIENLRWEEPYSIVNGELQYYCPQKGDIVFFDWDQDGDADHVGIVAGYTADGMVYTLEGNVLADKDGNTSVTDGYYQVVTTCRSEYDVLGYGVPFYSQESSVVDINATAISGGTALGKAYMLPTTNADTVWYVGKGDRCQVLCQDGDFYLLMYPFLNTGSYVVAYVPKSIISVKENISNAVDYYVINQKVCLKETISIYHNPSTQALIGASGLDNRIRGTLYKDGVIDVLFEMDGFYFITTDHISGFVDKNCIDLTNRPEQEGTSTEPDVSLPETTPVQYLAGDVNGDGVLTEDDGQLILQYCVHIIDLCDEERLRADADGNGKINSADAARVFMLICKERE